MHLPRKGRWAAALLAAFFSSCAYAQNANLCAACHGADGNSSTYGVPSIAGRPKLFIENQMILFREELRPSDQMLPVVKGLKDPEIIKLAEHFSRLPARAVSQGAENSTLVKSGQALAKKLRCGVCHLSDFSGQNQAATLYGVSDADITALAHFLSRSAPRMQRSTPPARAR